MLPGRFRKIAVLSKIDEPSTEILDPGSLESELGTPGVMGRMGTCQENLTHAICAALIRMRDAGF
jgi:hypothetical protein